MIAALRRAGARTDTEARALLLILDGVCLLDEIADRMGRSRMTTYDALRRLREAGLVTWEPGQHGTLRPLVKQVPLST